MHPGRFSITTKYCAKLTLLTKLSINLTLPCARFDLTQPCNHFNLTMLSLSHDDSRLHRNNSVLKIWNAVQEDDGTYTCTATNKAGTAIGSTTMVYTGKE